MTLSDEVKIRLAQETISAFREIAVAGIEEREHVQEMKQILYLSEQVLFLTKQYENAYVFQRLSIMQAIAKHMSQIDTIIAQLNEEENDTNE